jgi:tRNA(Ile)-lysidine synthase
MNKNKTLEQKFIAFNTAKGLSSAKKKGLLAVSGGIDSMVLCDLFHRSGFPFAIAHCNFGLRSAESNADAEFVKQAAVKYGVPFFSKTFNTAKYAADKNISIQLAARELRYAWFEEVRTANQFAFIATAHHLNDNIETIILNLIRGTGIRGLRGIPERQGRIIRPLLFASRQEIELYQQQNKLEYREDSSNANDRYTRNKIRHLLIPLMKEINPSLENTLAEKIELFTEIENLYEHKAAQQAKLLFLKRKHEIYIPILKLKKIKHAATVLYEYLKDYGFNAEHIEDMLSSLDGTPGKQYISDKARIIKDRRFFILTSLAAKHEGLQLIQESDTEIAFAGQQLRLDIVSAKDLKISAHKSHAFLDYAKLEFPLVLRPWKDGDYFYPFGMKLKKKKLKKFFVDEKIPRNEKEKIWVIESGQKIVWVIGYRIDERLKVDAKTQRVLRVQVK